MYIMFIVVDDISFILNFKFIFLIVVTLCLQFSGYLKAYFYFIDICIISPSSFAKGTPKGEGEGAE